MTRHSIAGVEVAHTKDVVEVLGDMEATTYLVLSMAPPPLSLEAWIACGQLRYAYEPLDTDNYLPWWQWPIIAADDWAIYRERVADVHPQVWSYGVPEPDHGLVSVIDCEDFATNGVAWRRWNGLRAWNVVAENRDRVTRRLRGWHALMLVELPEGQRHAAEIPITGRIFVLDQPGNPVTRRPGYRIALVDLAWMAGMPRREEGRFDVEGLRLAA